MKINLYTALLIVALLTIVNIIGGLINQQLNYAGQLKDVLRILPIHLIFGGLFWLTCIPKLIIDKALRLSLLRIIFWTIIVSYGFVTDSRMVSEDFLSDYNQSFCFFVNTIGLLLNKVNIGFLHNQYFEIFGINIIGVALYEFVIIKIAIFLTNYFHNQFDGTPQQSE